MRIGFWDLETTALKASFGQILCGIIGEYNSLDPTAPRMHEYRLHDFTTSRGRCDDSGLALDLKAAVEGYDLLIGYNSRQFDHKFLNTRLAKYGLPAAVITRHKDLLFVMRYKFSLQSNSLRNASIFLFGNTLKTEVSWDKWRLAHAGDIEAYEEVITHCQYDVLELARMFDRIKSVAGELK